VGDHQLAGGDALQCLYAVDDPADERGDEHLGGVVPAAEGQWHLVPDAVEEVAGDPVRGCGAVPGGDLADLDRVVAGEVQHGGHSRPVCLGVQRHDLGLAPGVALVAADRGGGACGAEIDPERVGHCWRSPPSERAGQVVSGWRTP
jgi:hypothetical protein